MLEKRIYSTQTKEVWLVDSPLQKTARVRLLEGLDRIAAIRADIAANAKVASMPPIEIVPYLWRHPDGDIIHGQPTILSVGEKEYFGVRLPAHTAVCTDIRAVRSVILHGFCHCFYFSREVMSREGGGLFDTQSVEETECLADARNWFGGRDVGRIGRSHDRRADAVTATAADLLAEGSLYRVTCPNLRVQSSVITISDDVAAHVEVLQHRAVN